MTNPARAIYGLEPLTWRDMTAQCELAPFDFAHSQAERRYPYVDGFGHDNTGRDSLRFTTRLYFLNTVEPGSFPDKWNAWRDALFDGSAGDLVHPVLGLVRARVMQGHVEYRAQTTAGVIVDVTFTETVDDPEVLFFFDSPTVALDAAAKAADNAASDAGINYPTGDPGGATSIAGAVAQFEGAITSFGMSVSGYANMVAAQIDGMISVAEGLTDPTKWPAYDNLVTAWSSVKNVAAKTALVSRATAQTKLSADMGLDAVASSVGNSLDDIINLNPSLVSKPTVPKGTTVTHYSGAQLNSPLGAPVNGSVSV